MTLFSNKKTLRKKDTPYISVFSPHAGKCGPEKPRIRTLFTQCNEYIEIHEPDDLTMRPVVGGPNCPTGPLSQLRYNFKAVFSSHKKLC